MEKSAHKLLLLERIADLEKKQLWHLDVEDDPETYPLMPDKVDYLNKKLKSKIMSRIANRAGEKFFETLIKNGQLLIKEVRGIENFTAVEGGRLITCNHFSVGDNYAVWRAIRDHVDGKMLYKVIREGNYTNPPKPFGLMMKHCNTLPLSSQTATMKKFNQAVRTLLARGESILIYPEQGMWWNYRKPRPHARWCICAGGAEQDPHHSLFHHHGGHGDHGQRRLPRAGLYGAHPPCDPPRHHPSPARPQGQDAGSKLRGMGKGL